ncbi:MAG: ABC transporter substrate-binding protein [Planctomycetes bacterium]|nr:ABC transporter substrate-binding protein [Planctomycetota bacterium]
MTEITIAHSPDTDDVFMFWAIAEGRLDTGDRAYALLAEDIEVLNRAAMGGRYEVTAISFGAYPVLSQRYAILDSGASIGDGYGPVLVARDDLRRDQLRGRRIAIPGELTTAHLAARLALPDFEAVEMPFKAIGPAVVAGEVSAGLLIHEGQLTWRELGLVKLLDLGAWWQERHDLPLPLGGNAVRRDLGPELMRAVADDCRRSIEMARAQLDEALAWTQERCPGLDLDGGKRYLEMYVNDETVAMSPRTREGLARLYREAAGRGFVPRDLPLDIVS